MIIVSKSDGRCGVCGTPFSVEWDPDMTGSYERNMGPEVEYGSEEELVCEGCGNLIRAKLRFYEYPAGALESEPDVYASGSLDSEDCRTMIEKPVVELWDL